MPTKAFLHKKSLLDQFKDDYKSTGYIQSARAEHTWSNPLTRRKRTNKLNGWIKSFQGKRHVHKLARFNAMQAGKNEDANSNLYTAYHISPTKFETFRLMPKSGMGTTFYGRGIYLTYDKSVIDHYKNLLADYYDTLYIYTVIISPKAKIISEDEIFDYIDDSVDLEDSEQVANLLKNKVDGIRYYNDEDGNSVVIFNADLVSIKNRQECSMKNEAMSLKGFLSNIGDKLVNKYGLDKNKVQNYLGSHTQEMQELLDDKELSLKEKVLFVRSEITGEKDEKKSEFYMDGDDSKDYYYCHRCGRVTPSYELDAHGGFCSDCDARWTAEHDNESKKPANEKLGYEKGHKNSRGEDAPWVIRSHKDNRILASFATEDEAKEHMKRMKQYSKQEAYVDNSATAQKDYIERVISAVQDYYGYSLFDAKNLVQRNAEKVKDWYMSGEVSDVEAARCLGRNCEPTKKESKDEASDIDGYISDVISNLVVSFHYGKDGAKKLVNQHSDLTRDNYVDGELSAYETARAIAKADGNTYAQEESKKSEANGPFDAPIKDWYMGAYKDDDLGDRLNGTFKGVLQTLLRGDDVYTYIGVGDSLIRERLFSQLAKMLDVDYDEIYNVWLNEGAASNELTAKLNKIGLKRTRTIPPTIKDKVKNLGRGVLPPKIVKVTGESKKSEANGDKDVFTIDLFRINTDGNEDMVDDMQAAQTFYNEDEATKVANELADAYANDDGVVFAVVMAGEHEKPNGDIVGEPFDIHWASSGNPEKTAEYRKKAGYAAFDNAMDYYAKQTESKKLEGIHLDFEETLQVPEWLWIAYKTYDTTSLEEDEIEMLNDFREKYKNYLLNDRGNDPYFSSRNDFDELGGNVYDVDVYKMSDEPNEKKSESKNEAIKDFPNGTNYKFTFGFRIPKNADIAKNAAEKNGYVAISDKDNNVSIWTKDPQDAIRFADTTVNLANEDERTKLERSDVDKTFALAVKNNAGYKENKDAIDTAASQYALSIRPTESFDGLFILGELADVVDFLEEIK